MLPTLDNEYTERELTDTFLGYRHRLKIEDGELYDAENLTNEFYPLLASRKKRGELTRLTAPGGLTAREKLAWVDGGTLYYDGQATALTGLSSGKKQLVGMGAYLIVFPDKRWYNTADPTAYGNLEAVYTSTGTVEYSLCGVDGSACSTPTVSDAAPADPDNGALWIDTSVSPQVLRQWSQAQDAWGTIVTPCTKLRFISEGELPQLFARDDGVTISGALGEVNGSAVIRAIGGGDGERDYLVVAGLLDGALTQTEGSVKIERRVPEMDYIVEAQNRLWGCRYGMSGGKMLNELYCCALGDFKNWRQYMGLSTDSWTASVGSDGPWTGAVNYLGYPTFFKENRIYRIAVSAYGGHQVSETVCRGVQEGSAGSLQVVNETLLYKSRSDVCAYQGSFPQSISEALGEQQFSAAVGGAVGERYYLCMTDAEGARSLFVFDLRRGLWMREDALDVTDFAALGGELYALCADGRLVSMRGTAGEPEPCVRWMAETGLLSYSRPDRKYVSRFNLRLELEEGAEVQVYLMYDSNGEWVRQGRIRMKGTRTVTLPVRPRRCDHLRIRLVGKGQAKLYALSKIVSFGSDVG